MSEIQEAVNEIINEIIEYLEKQGGKVQTLTENDRTVIKLESPLELTSEQYNEKLYRFLNDLGFYASNTAEDQTNSYWGYKSWIGVDVYRSYSTGTEVVIYYTKVLTKGETTYFVKKVEIITSEAEGEEE